MSHQRSFGLLLLATLAATPALSGPLAAQRGLREVYEWGTSGFAFDFLVPVGPMAQYVDWGGGMDAFYQVKLGPLPIGLRFEGGFLFHELSYTSDANVYTSSASYIGSFRGGPQLTIGGDGPMRLYGLALIGPSYFGTIRSVSTYDCGCSNGSATETLSGDWTWGVEMGGGMQFQMGRQNSPVMLDLGLRLVHHEDARFLGAGPVVNGTRTYDEIRGPAEYAVFKLGFTFSLR